MTTAFKIFTADQWAAFQTSGVFEGAPIDLADGYIHLSTAEQLEETLTKHFAGQSGLVVAEIAFERFGDTLKWEPSRGGVLFPHVYEGLELADVIGMRSVETG